MAHTVLIVDDKNVIRQALCRLFKSASGFEVCGEASNGPEAIEVARSLQPDLIVLDLLMPGMTGLETAQQLKELGLPAKIILYSLNAEDVGEQKTLPVGVSAVVSKAEGVKTLVTKARTVLRNG